MSSHSVTNQPQPILDLESLDFKQSIPVHEKCPTSLENEDHHHHHHHCEHGQTSFSEHDRCHNSRLRRFMIPAIFLVVALFGLLAWNCVHGMPAWGVTNLMGRDTTNQSAFVHKKRKFLGTTLYIYIQFESLISNHLSVNLYSLYYCCCSGWTFCGSCTWYHVGCMVLFRSVFFSIWKF